MALLTMILRKMAKNRWLQLNLWLGLTVCVALFCSLPLYSSAILERTLLKELQLLQENRGVYPGKLRVGNSILTDVSPADITKHIQRADQRMDQLPDRFELPTNSYLKHRGTSSFSVNAVDDTEAELKNRNIHAFIRTVTDMDKRARLIGGRMPDPARNDGVYEALVSQKFLIELKRDLNVEFIGVQRSTGKEVRIVPVGIADFNVSADPYLPFDITAAGKSFYIPFDQFEKDFVIGGKLSVSSLEYQYALDYNEMTVAKIGRFQNEALRLKSSFGSWAGTSSLDIPAATTIEKYLQQEEKLNLMLWSLYIPVMLMLAFYLYMASNLIIERQKTDISVLRSRGASRLQIMSGYLVEGLILGASALAVGPFLGIGLTKVLGASSGFLEFVQRAPLQITLDSTAYKIAAAAVAGAIVLMLIPAFLATRASIVSHKQQMARAGRSSFWHRMFIDIILVGISVYLLNGFRVRMKDLQQLALDSTSLQIDPLIFLTPALFVLGGGLLVLRVYPWFIRLIFWIGKRFWSPAMYSTLIQISRSSGQYLTIKVFLIMTVAIGLFSANAARTINENMEDKIRYGIGADMTLQLYWENDAPPETAGGIGEPASAQEPQVDPNTGGPKRVQYTEPPFLPFTQLDGVESAARVFRNDEASFDLEGNQGRGAATLMGINTYEFGQTVWMRDSLLDHTLNAYLNLMADDPEAVLVSRSFAEEFGTEPGDRISTAWSGLDQTSFVIYGIVDYWPGWNPLPRRLSDGKEAARPHLIVGHLATIQNRLALEPYDVWIKLKEGGTSKQVYDSIAEEKLRVTQLIDANQELNESKNDPFRLAINGVMTLGFVISMVISFFGFLLFWMLTLSGRTLQYGILRAMGIPFRQIIAMLISEQVLTSGAAVLIGVLIGNTVSELFVPLFELSFHPSEQVPPFQIMQQLSDYIQVYGIVTLTIVLGLCILGYRLSRINIHQALRLGEE
ncbi:FtsX-like permease family protein [Paenibacillus tarimensis]